MKRMLLSLAVAPILAGSAGLSVTAQETVPTGVLVEAENYAQAEKASVKDWSDVDGTQASGKKGCATDHAYDGGYMKYEFDVPSAGTYDMEIRYVSMNTRWAEFKLNSQISNVVCFDTFSADWDGKPSTADANDGIASKKIKVYLEAGQNTLTVAPIYGYSPEEGRDVPYMPSFDCFVFTPSDEQIVKPADWTEANQLVREADNPGDGSNGSVSDRSGFRNGKGYDLSANETAFTKVGRYKMAVPEAGYYKLTVYYATCQRRWIGVRVGNDGKPVYLSFVETTPDWNGDNGVYARQAIVYLDKGDNTLIFGNYTRTDGNFKSEHGDSPSIDYFTLDRVNAVGYIVLAKPFYEMAISDLAEWSAEGIDLTAVTDHNARTMAIAERRSASITLEFPYNVLVSGYAWASNSNTDSWKVELSADGNEWVERELAQTDMPRCFTNPLAGGACAYRYVRLTMDGDEAPELGGFVVFGNPYCGEDCHIPAGMLDTMLDYSYSDEGEKDVWNQGVDHLFDGLTDKQYTSKESNFYVEVQLERPAVLSAYMISTHYTTGNFGRAPKAWTIEAKVEKDTESALAEDSEDTDGDSPATVEYEYVTLDRRENVNFGVPASTVYAQVDDNEIESDCYRLTINHTGVAHMSGLQLFAAENDDEPNFPTGVEELTSDDIMAVAGLNGVIYIKADHAGYAVYNIQGMEVAAGSVCGEAEVAVGGGIYVVRVGDRIFKVIVR